MKYSICIYTLGDIFVPVFATDDITSALAKAYGLADLGFEVDVDADGTTVASIRKRGVLRTYTPGDPRDYRDLFSNHRMDRKNMNQIIVTGPLARLSEVAA